MNEYYQDNEFQDFSDEEDTIDWSKYISAGLQYWKRIAIITFCFAVISVIVALTQKRVYKVEITLAPEVQSSTRSSSLGGLAGMLGFNLNLNAGAMASDAFNITIFPEILSSTPFLTQLFEVQLSPKPKNLPKDATEARRIIEGPLPTVSLFDHLTGRDKEKSFFRRMINNVFGEQEQDPEYLRVNPNILTKEQSNVLKILRKMIDVDVDKNSAMTNISVKMDDPLMCMQLADTVCRRLREYVYQYRTEKERKNFDYYSALCDSAYLNMVEAQSAYAESIDNDRSVILQKVSVKRQRLEMQASMASQLYQQMVQQRELSRAQLQNVKPVFAVVEPAVMPVRSANSKKKVCLFITFLGFMLSCAWYIVVKDLYETYLQSFMSKLKEE